MVISAIYGHAAAFREGLALVEVDGTAELTVYHAKGAGSSYPLTWNRRSYQMKECWWISTRPAIPAVSLRIVGPAN